MTEIHVDRPVVARPDVLPALRAGLSHEDDVLIARFYLHVAGEDLQARSDEEMLEPPRDLRRFATDRPVGRALVRVVTSSDERKWLVGKSVIHVVTDDMPFLVDSVVSAVTRLKKTITLVVHPQMVVRRDVAGHLLEVCALDPLDLGKTGSVPRSHDMLVESWMRIELEGETSDTEAASLVAKLQDVLRDVRETVEDWPRMRQRANDLSDSLILAPPSGVAVDEDHEAAALLRWLANDHFTFLGYREYDLVGEPGEETLNPLTGTGLGILRSDQGASSAFAKLPAKARAAARERHVLVVTKANSRSTVHRAAYLDYIGVKRFDAQGNVDGERRFLGLFTSTAYNQSVLTIPVLRRKVDDVLAQVGYAPNSHGGKDLLEFFETYPRDELFQVDEAELADVAMAVHHMRERRQTRLFLRADRYERFVSALVYLPRDRYTTTVRLRMEQILAEAYGADSIDYTARVSESILARLHFVVRVPTGTPLPDVDVDGLQTQLAQATRSWDDDFTDVVSANVSNGAAGRLLAQWAQSVPEGYKEDFPADRAFIDVKRLDAQWDEHLQRGPEGPVDTSRTAGMSVSFYVPHDDDDEATRRFKVYRVGSALSLSEVLPVLQNLGVEVIDERPYEFERDHHVGSNGEWVEDAPHDSAWIYDFGMRFDPRNVVDLETLPQRFEEAFLAAWANRVESDRFNALVVVGGLTARQAMLIRAYSRYLRQTGSSFSQEYIESCFIANVDIARLLVKLFETRCDPDFIGRRGDQTANLAQQIESALDDVASLDQDRILRSFLALIGATLRSNAYQRTRDGQTKPTVSFKFDPAAIPDLPAPRPKYEIWVYAPAVEGVHLRFGAVARGGLRWSDRREDFRTEVLGLVKAQAVKNAVIVPVGAKGGFVLKGAPDSTDRERYLAAGIAGYRAFVSAMLDITDNLVSGQIVPPPAVVRHDGDDPYLVVAADKGTATFSDIANEISKSYNFWLGDAFASGGSEGYDHKVMGITARGAWESVKRHFREIGRDTQSHDFTVVGVGDMSGDVFGNGMLLSQHIKLVAAFDHRHIFLDPDPDAVASLAERLRLFDLPRSSWADYKIELISEGGGVFARTAKSIPLTPEVRNALGIPDGIVALTPAELMKTILRAPVDLLWNGGIGTYVKSDHESHLDVGDKANDAIRVNGSQLRCKVVGEGGNLGFTQLGRVEAAQSGVRLNTDAIDNSAGVDTSDHEVNIKILLDAAVLSGDLDEAGRNALLEEMTDEVAQDVLADNYAQNILLSNARAQVHSMLSVHQRFIRQLEARGELNRALEFLPTDTEIDTRHAAGSGLTSPELCVLVAYSKMMLAHEIPDSKLPDEAWFGSALRSYFPGALVARYDDRLDDHPLRRDIITTVVANELVNRGGITFAFRANEDTGARASEIARAFFVVREAFALPALWHRIEALDNLAPTSVQTAMLLEIRRFVDRASRWLLQSRGGAIDVATEIERFRGEVARLAPLVSGMLMGSEQERFQRRQAEFAAAGAPRELARDVAAVLDLFSMLDVITIARAADVDPEPLARLYFALSERYEVDRMLSRISGLPRGDRWSTLARSALRSDLYGALAGLAQRVNAVTSPADPPADRMIKWEEANSEGLARARATLAEISELETFDLATLSVALRTIRTLVSQSSV